MPGYCVQGTVGHKILSGQRKLELEGRQVVSLRRLCQPQAPLRWVGARERPPVLMACVL